MIEASTLLAEVRTSRYLSMNTLADISGVPVSTISRIESGKVDPTWSMMTRILAAAGYELELTLADSGTDEPFAGIIRRLHNASHGERSKIVRRFPMVAQLAPVSRRAGVRRVELGMTLGEAITNLEKQGRSPVVSSLEAYVDDGSRVRSFAQVVYVDDPASVTGFAPVTRTSPNVMFLLPITRNVRAATRPVGSVVMVSREWALLDSLASPGRQTDFSMYLIDDLISVLAT